MSTAPGLLLTSFPDSPGKQPKRQMLPAQQSLAGSLLQIPTREMPWRNPDEQRRADPTINICSQLYSLCIQGSKLIPCHSKFNLVFSLIFTTASWSQARAESTAEASTSNLPASRRAQPTLQRPHQGSGARVSPPAAASTQAKSISLPQLTQQACTPLPLLH